MQALACWCSRRPVALRLCDWSFTKSTVVGSTTNQPTNQADWFVVIDLIIISIMMDFKCDPQTYPEKPATNLCPTPPHRATKFVGIMLASHAIWSRVRACPWTKANSSHHSRIVVWIGQGILGTETLPCVLCSRVPVRSPSAESSLPITADQQTWHRRSRVGNGNPKTVCQFPPQSCQAARKRKQGQISDARIVSQIIHHHAVDITAQTTWPLQVLNDLEQHSHCASLQLYCSEKGPLKTNAYDIYK